MELSELITLDRTACNLTAQSKKRALEEVSELIAHGEPDVTSNEVFESLLARERLGGTGIGHGVAIPHGRLKNTKHTIGAFIKLQNAIDFDAVDQQPVDLLFALLVPENSTQEHLQVLASLASMFNDEETREKIRQSSSPEEIHQLISNWKPS